jgi:hypothetical protein
MTISRFLRETLKVDWHGPDQYLTALEAVTAGTTRLETLI